MHPNKRKARLKTVYVWHIYTIKIALFSRSARWLNYTDYINKYSIFNLKGSFTHTPAFILKWKRRAL